MNNEKIVVGSRKLIKDLLLKNNGSVTIDKIRNCAIGKEGDYALVGVFIPITVKGRLSFRRIEEELQILKSIGEIDINDGIVTLLKKDELGK